MGFWWDDEENDETPEQRNKSAMQVLLDHKNINEQTLTKRFNNIVAAQSMTMDSKLFEAVRERKRFLKNVEYNKEVQQEYLTYIGAWNSVLHNIKTYGFYEAKERVQIDLDALENSDRKVDVQTYNALRRTIGFGDEVIAAWVKGYSKSVEKHKDIEREWQTKADEMQTKIDGLQQSISANPAQKSEARILAEEFAADYKRYETLNPESEFVSKMKNMVKDAYGQDRYIGSDTILDLANRIVYGIATNVFAEGRINDGEGR